MRRQLVQTPLCAALALALAPACKDESAPEVEPEPEPELSPIDEVEGALADIHDALPADLRDSIQFEAATREDGDMAGAVPAGWESGAIPTDIRPPDEADLGFHTQYGLGFACAGRCEPKPWETELKDEEFAQYVATEAFDVIRDERVRPSGRIVVAERGEAVYVTVAWWEAGASRYAFCRATLDGPAAPAAEAFEKACLATRFDL